MDMKAIHRGAMWGFVIASLLCAPLLAQMTASTTPGFKNGVLTVGASADSLYQIPRVRGDSGQVPVMLADSTMGWTDLSISGDTIIAGTDTILVAGIASDTAQAWAAILRGEMPDSALSVWSDTSGNYMDLATVRAEIADSLDEYSTMQTGITTGTVDTKFKYTGSWATAGEDLVFGNVVYYAADSTWMKADADTVGTAYNIAWGFVAADISNGSTGTIMRRGTAFLTSWDWTPGAVLYVSTTAGAITESPDTSAGHVLQIVGFALHPDLIEFDPDPTWARK